MESMGVVVRRYRLPHISYPYSSCTCSFLQQHPYFLFILKMFFVLVQLEISHRTRWWCLKCVIVYLARDILAFAMYCAYGASRSSLLIELPTL